MAKVVYRTHIGEGRKLAASDHEGCDDTECITDSGERGRESGNYFFGEEAHSAASQEASGIPYHCVSTGDVKRRGRER